MPATNQTSVYADLTLAAVPRALALQDTGPASPTLGCCDRGYWHYKTLVDFPAATMQQLALPFAISFAVDFPGNEHYGKPAMLERARSAVYPASSLRDLPADLRTAGFDHRDNEFALRAEFLKNTS